MVSTDDPSPEPYTNKSRRKKQIKRGYDNHSPYERLETVLFCYVGSIKREKDSVYRPTITETSRITPSFVSAVQENFSPPLEKTMSAESVDKDKSRLINREDVLKGGSNQRSQVMKRKFGTELFNPNTDDEAFGAGEVVFFFYTWMLLLTHKVLGIVW